MEEVSESLEVFVRYPPLEEVSVLGLADQARSHHDGLEALALDGPQVALGDRSDGRRSLAIVQDGQLAEHLGARKGREVFALAGDLNAAIWKETKG